MRSIIVDAAESNGMAQDNRQVARNPRNGRENRRAANFQVNADMADFDFAMRMYESHPDRLHLCFPGAIMIVAQLERTQFLAVSRAMRQNSTLQFSDSLMTRRNALRLSAGSLLLAHGASEEPPRRHLYGSGRE
jgi:hypothetical protein